MRKERQLTVHTYAGKTVLPKGRAVFGFQTKSHDKYLSELRRRVRKIGLRSSALFKPEQREEQGSQRVNYLTGEVRRCYD